MNSNKIIVNEKLIELSKKLKQNKKIVLCHGVFDLLYIGHIKYLQESSKKGCLDSYSNRKKICRKNS